MKKVGGILASSAIAAALMFASITPAFAAPAPKPADPDSLTWNAKYATAAAAQGPVTSTKTDASGDKIPSNAHSADYPGLYFYWNDVQKDNAVLLVDPSVFSWFTDGEFVLTAKNSNNYWDWRIAPDPKYLIDGVYAYGIAKQVQYLDSKGKSQVDSLKNINMVFISGNWKTASFTIVKNWLDPNDDAIDSIGDYMTGLGATTPVVTFSGGAYKPGITYTERLMAHATLDKNFAEDAINWSYHVDEACSYTDYSTELVSSDNTSISLIYGASATVTFTNAVRAVTTPTCGSYTIEKVWLDVDGKVITDQALIDEYNSYLSFTDAIGTETYTLGTVSDVPAGTVVSMTEDDVLWESATATNYYWFEPAGITVNGVDVTTVNETIVAGENTHIVFTNRMHTREIGKPGGPLAPPIPSVQHADMWLKDFGIICYSSNTTGAGDYFVAFAPNYWDTHTSVTIGLGTKNTITHMVTFTKDSVTGVVISSRATTTFYMDTHYSNGGAKNVEFAGYDVITFPNPWGSGASQAYLMDVQ